MSYIELPKADGTVQRIRRHRLARYQVVVYDRRADRYVPVIRDNDPDACHAFVAICRGNGRGIRDHEVMLVIDENGEVCD